MSVIVRQGLKHSIVTLLATAIGMLNLLFIYTAVLSKTELGFYKYFFATAQLIFPFLVLGFTSVAVRYYPIFRDFSEKKNGFLPFLITVPFVLFLFVFSVAYLFEDSIFLLFDEHENKDLILKYFPILPILVFALMFNSLLAVYISNFKRIVLPEVFNNLWLKIAVPILAITYFLGYISFSWFIYGILIAYLTTTIALVAYLARLGELDLYLNTQHFKRPLNKEIATYASFSVMSLAGHLLATQIDTFMVGSLINADNAGVYVVALSIATVIGIPFRSMTSIVSPIISESFKQKDFANINKLYAKTALNLLIIGFLLFIGIWASVDFIFEIIPSGEEYKEGKYVILFLGLAKIVDMTTGLNHWIISFSDHYKFNLYFGLISAVFNIGFNILFISVYGFGILGAAISTLLSMIIYNLLKFLFILIKLKMQPLSWNMLFVLLIGVGAFLVATMIPKTGNPYFDILINSITIALIYLPGVLYFNLSEDLSKLSKQLFNAVKTL